MSALPSLGDASVRRYIQQLCLRSSGAPRHYRRILSDFQCFVGKAGAVPLSVAVIQDWLRDHASLRPLPVVLYDARLSIGFSTGQWQRDPFKVIRSPNCDGSTFSEPRRRLCGPCSTPIPRPLWKPSDRCRASEVFWAPRCETMWP
jgi:hypothetical protein